MRTTIQLGCSTGLLVSLAIFVLSEAAGQSSSSPTLQQFYSLQKVADQKFEFEVNRALQQLAVPGTSARQARITLKLLRQQLDRDTTISPAKRRELTRRIQTALGAAKPPARTSANQETQTPQFGTSSATPMPRSTAQANADFQAALRSLAELQRAGRYVEAEQQVNSLLAKYPDHPLAQVLARRASLATRIQDAQKLVQDSASRVEQALRDVDRSSLPANGDVEFPEDWQEKTARRAQDTLTDKERALLKALEKPVTLKFQAAPFTQVLQQLSDTIGQPIIVDKAALEASEIASNAPVSIVAGKISVRTALRKILSDLGLAYIIKNETILVTSQFKAQQMMVTRVYYLGDLLQGGTFSNAVQWGPYLSQLQEQENARQIVNLIQQSIDPQSWREQGGLGSIRYLAPLKALVVRQTAEVHSLLQSKLPR